MTPRSRRARWRLHLASHASPQPVLRLPGIPQDVPIAPSKPKISRFNLQFSRILVGLGSYPVPRLATGIHAAVAQVVAVLEGLATAADEYTPRTAGAARVTCWYWHSCQVERPGSASAVAASCVQPNNDLRVRCDPSTASLTRRRSGSRSWTMIQVPLAQLSAAVADGAPAGP